MKNKLVILSGAGLSAESGIPTFRDSGGLWEGHDVNTVANYLTFKKNKELVYRFYNERRRQMTSVHPNPGHHVLSRLQAEFGPEQVVIITQNVDDLLERAGCKHVIHVHGNIKDGQCIGNPTHRWELQKDLELSDRCPTCGGGVKPGIVMFHENAPLYMDMYRAFKSLTERDIFLVIGTNGQVVYPDLALRSRAYKILLTIDAGVYDPAHFDTFIVTPAGEALPELEESFRKHLKG